MTDEERRINHFHANAPRCKNHGERPAYDWTGIHTIDCKGGCYMQDAEHSSPNELFMRWDAVNKR